MVCVVTDGAALVAGVIVAPAAGVIVAPAAGVVLATGAGVVLAVVIGAGVVATVGAGVVVVLAAAGLDVAFVFGEAGVVAVTGVGGIALGDVFASAAGAFEFLLFRDDFCCFVTSGVAPSVAAGSSAFVFGAVAFVFFWFFVFFSRFVGGAVIVGASFVAGIFAAGSFMAGASVFGARDGLVTAGCSGFVVAGSSFLGPLFFSLPGGCDSSGVGD